MASGSPATVLVLRPLLCARTRARRGPLRAHAPGSTKAPLRPSLSRLRSPPQLLRPRLDQCVKTPYKPDNGEFRGVAAQRRCVDRPARGESRPLQSPGGLLGTMRNACETRHGAPVPTSGEVGTSRIERPFAGSVLRLRTCGAMEARGPQRGSDFSLDPVATRRERTWNSWC